MPGWTTLPCSSGALIRPQWFAELKAAIDERIDAASVGLTKPTAVGSDDLLGWDRITEYRGRIEALILKFYYQTGTGADLTFTAYNKAVIMTECFGAGVTDWPNKNDKLLRASHWNDMREVLNRMAWFRISASWNYPHSAGYTNSGLAVVGNSKASAQAAFDSLADEFQQDNLTTFCGIKSAGYRSGDWGPYYPSYYLASNDEWVTRDNQSVKSINIPNVSFTDAYLAIAPKNFKGPTQRFGGQYLAPSQTLTITFYHGTAAIPETFSGIRSYGAPLVAWSSSQIEGLVGYPTLRYVRVIAPNIRFTAGVPNHFRLTGRATLGGELNNMDWWYSGGYVPHFSAGASLSALMLKGQFSYS